MLNLCYSTFMHLIQEHYCYDITSDELAGYLFDKICPETERKKYTDTYLGFFWNRNRNITSEIKGYILKPEIKKSCKEHFTNVIAVQINQIIEDDFYTKLENLISNDDSITSRKKSSFHETFKSGNKGKYLYDVFIYALNKPNKDIVSNISKDDLSLISQVDQKCPICHEDFCTKINNRDYWHYSIIRIYPEFLDSSLKTIFDEIKPKPDQPDDPINKICLCDNCASDYLFSPSSEFYDKLLRLKNKILNNPSSSPIATQDLDEKIKLILDKLGEENPDGPLINNSRMKPLKLINKIPKENYLLIKAIRDDNDTYFWFIKDHISQMDAYKSSFRLIASQIHTSFINLDNKGYSQDKIYNDLIDWILNKVILPNTYRQAAHIIVSFFVQNCEVFDEIPE